MNVLHRCRIGLAILGLLSATACSEDAPRSEPVRVTSASTSPSTIDPETTSTTVIAPVPTKPLTTAPPSELLTEITAAYDAAYSDLLAAGEIPDEDYRLLATHIAGDQLTTWRQIIRDLRLRGQRVEPGAAEGWRRIEAIKPESPTLVGLEVCRLDTEEVVGSGSTEMGSSSRPYRYLETFTRKDGDWKWTARELLDKSETSSDCSLRP